MRLFAPRKSPRQQEFEAEALQYLDVLYAHALRLTRSPSDAEDLVQDTFVRALRFYDRFERGSNLKAWLLRIQFNGFVNRYRRHVKEHQASESLVQEPAGEATLGREALRSLLDPQAIALAPVVAKEIESALAKLPEEHRTVVILADVEELSYKEIAEVIGCPIGTVMSRLHRARKALQELLVEHAVSLGLDVGKRAEQATPEAADNTVVLANYRRQRSRG
ncbi:MAG TPA: sigma-70 family RNA polymerase sigma factor [Polyangiales bacterium]|nr:sigma-70 family RNA polymerase sigma factor [Polyangiales bacterium]